MQRAAIVFAALLVGLLAVPALADVVHLKNGGRIEGKVVDKGDAYEVTHRYGKITVKKSDVVSIEKKATLAETYAKKRAAIDVKNADQLVALAKWCRENGWETQAVKDFRAALALDPDHRGAHTALGHVFYEGAWRTEDEIMEMRGFVKHLGKWVTREEAARLEAKEAAHRRNEARKREAKKLQRKVNRWFRDIAYGTKKKCDKAYGEVLTFAKERKNEKLAKYAGDVKAYFDRYWKAVRESQKGTLEIRATMSKLKRPIPSFTTSLGSGPPVTLQLPELSIARIQTTVVVPMGRGE
ncbi:MAG: hypothetical protein ACYS99_11225 [Planctomycetota bacterium]|jgi:hypothetical protein